MTPTWESLSLWNPNWADPTCPAKIDTTDWPSILLSCQKKKRWELKEFALHPQYAKVTEENCFLIVFSHALNFTKLKTGHRTSMIFLTPSLWNRASVPFKWIKSMRQEWDLQKLRTMPSSNYWLEVSVWSISLLYISSGAVLMQVHVCTYFVYFLITICRLEMARRSRLDVIHN